MKKRNKIIANICRLIAFLSCISCCFGQNERSYVISNDSSKVKIVILSNSKLHFSKDYGDYLIPLNARLLFESKEITSIEVSVVSNFCAPVMVYRSIKTTPTDTFSFNLADYFIKANKKNIKYAKTNWAFSVVRIRLEGKSGVIGIPIKPEYDFYIRK